MNFNKVLLSILFLLSFIPQSYAQQVDSYSDNRTLEIDKFTEPMAYPRMEEFIQDYFPRLSEVSVESISWVRWKDWKEGYSLKFTANLMRFQFQSHELFFPIYKERRASRSSGSVLF